MNFAFIIDTSISMLQQGYNNLSLLDMAKNAVEYFLKLRPRYPESKFDSYHLFTTGCQPSNPLITPLSSWDNDVSHFQTQLKNISYSIFNDIPDAIIQAYSTLNFYRVFAGCDNYYGGRDPYKLDNGVVIVITDSTDCLNVANLEKVFGNQNQRQPYKWDQQLIFFQMAIPSSGERNFIDYNKYRTKIPYAELMDSVATFLGGRLYAVDSYERLIDIMDNFLQNLRHKISFILENKPLTRRDLNSKFIRDSGIKVPEKVPFCSYMNKRADKTFLSQKEFQVRVYVKVPLNYLQSRHNPDPQNLSQTYSRFPFPEDSVNPIQSYPGTPRYFVDFSKVFHYRLSNEIPCDRFEIECVESDLVINTMVEGIIDYRKIYFPVYTIVRNPQGEPENSLFGLLKFTKREPEVGNLQELFLFGANFTEFFNIFEELRSTSITQNTTIKLEKYFERIPNYYWIYYKHYFEFKKYRDYCSRRWKFAPTRIEENSINKYLIKEFQEKKKRFEDGILKLNSQKRLKKGMQNSAQNNSNEPLASPILETQHISPKKNLIKQLLLKKTLILKDIPDIDSLLPPRSKSQPIMRTSEILEMEKKIPEFRNPYVDENESKFVKEPIPFGNPFKLQIRMKSQRLNVTGEINDEALYSSVKLDEGRELSSKERLLPERPEEDEIKPEPPSLKRKKSDSLSTSASERNTASEEKTKNELENSGIEKIAEEPVEATKAEIFGYPDENLRQYKYQSMSMAPPVVDYHRKEALGFLMRHFDKLKEILAILNGNHTADKKCDKLRDLLKDWLKNVKTDKAKNIVKAKIKEILDYNNFKGFSLNSF